MNRNEARQLAKTIPQDVCSQMLRDAINLVTKTSWEKPSRDNKGMSRGSCWNALFKDLDFKKDIPEIIRYRIVREFEEFLPAKYVPIKNHRMQPPKATHFAPDFTKIKF